MPVNFVGTSSSSVVGQTSKFNNEYSSSYSASTTTSSYIYKLEPGESYSPRESLYGVLQDMSKSGATLTSRWSYFKIDSESGGISWQKYFTSPVSGGIFIKYARGTEPGEFSTDYGLATLFVSKSNSTLSAVDPETGDARHSITITSPTGGIPSILSIEYKQGNLETELYIGGNYLNASNGQEGFISKLTYRGPTQNNAGGFTLVWTVAISGPVAAGSEICQVESICPPYDGTANVFCGGYVSTSSGVYRPFLLALNPSTGATVWERIFSTYDNSTPLAITSIVADTSSATAKLICGGTFYSYNSTLATPTIIAINVSGNGSSLVSRCIVPATSMSGYSGETKIYRRDVFGSIGSLSPIPNTSVYTVGNAAFGTSSSNYSPGYFSLTSSFDGSSTHSLDASNYYNLRNPEYSLPGPYGVQIYSIVDGISSSNGDFIAGEVSKKISPAIDGVSQNSIGFLIKNGSVENSPFTFRESGAQINFVSGSPTWTATQFSFTNSAASTNLNQATVTFSIATVTANIDTYSIPKTSSVKTEEYPGLVGPV